MGAVWKPIYAENHMSNNIGRPNTAQPMTTSNYFEAGHRLRLEVSSSNFPRFDRNLNTGGKNYDESRGVVAHNAVHHSKQYPSELKLTVVKK